MGTFQIYLLCFALILEASAVVVLLGRAARLNRRLETLHAVCNERLGALEAAVAVLEGESSATPETRAEDRKRALEAERRFTEGVANILGFSCGTAVKRGEA